MTEKRTRTDELQTDPPPRIAKAASVVLIDANRPPAATPAVSAPPLVAGAPDAGAVARGAADVVHDKEVAFYGAVVNAWISTRMEFDKSLMAVSLAGIGLIVTLLTTAGVPSALALGIFAAAVLALSVTVGLSLSILHRNGDFLTTLAEGGGSDGDSHSRKLDRWALRCFGVGMLFTVAAAGVTAWHKYEHPEAPPPSAPATTTSAPPLDAPPSGTPSNVPSGRLTAAPSSSAPDPVGPAPSRGASSGTDALRGARPYGPLTVAPQTPRESASPPDTSRQHAPSSDPIKKP